MTEPQREEFPPIRELLDRLGIRLRTSRGQHFLRRQEICARIAEFAGLTDRHNAVEVGAGLGNLTVELAARAGKVLAVEADPLFAEWHAYLENMYPSLKIISGDFLEIDLDEMLAAEAPEGPVAGAGNLPYQITSEILFRFVNAERTFDRLVFMMQKEVADRICAGAGERASGALTYKVALRYRAEIAFDLEPGAFLPPPKVRSAVVVLEPLEEPLIRDREHRDRVYRLVDGIFQYRRKTIANGMKMSGITSDREEAEAMLDRAGIDPKRRPETLSIEELLRLTEES